MFHPGNCEISNTIFRKQDLYEIRNAATPYELVDTLKKQVQQKEEEMNKVEQINKNFERMIQLVNIMGQVNNFLASRSRSVIKKIAMLADADEGQYEKEFNRKYYHNE